VLSSIRQVLGGKMFLQVSFLQNPVAITEASGKSINLEPKTSAFLCFLLAENEPVRRETLSSTFWPDLSTSNIYREVSRIRKQLPFLLDDREKGVISVREDVRLVRDVDMLMSAGTSEDASQWEKACAVYKAKFMAEYEEREISRSFSSWLWKRQRESEHIAQKIFSNLINHYRWASEFELALTLANDFLKIHPVNQVVFQQKLRLLAGLEQYTEAIESYREWAREFEQTFSLEPDESAKELYDRLLELRNFPRYSIPPQLTTFVGREQELKILARQISDENCRIITLIGTGGIGKTRLALQLAKKLNPCFLHGTCFVPLDSVEEAHVIDAVAQALGVALVGKTPFIDKIIRVLVPKEILLVLDSAEKHDRVGEVISQLLRRVPGIKILVTSRRRLHIFGEHVFEVQGFELPSKETVNPHELEAVNFFLTTAQRNKPDFLIDSHNAADVIQIIQVLDGVPLAIELAAAKVFLYSCQEILSKIRIGLDVLEYSGSGYSRRHLSVQATFDYSWGLLTEKERKTLSALSVFAGGFTRKAASNVTETSSEILNSLLDHCLIKQEREDRYDFHPLIHQFAAKKLDKDTTANEKYQMRHRQYFAEWLGTRMAIVGEYSLVKHWREIDRENSNIRKAWQQAIEVCDLESLDKLKHLWGYFELQALYQAGYAVFVLPPDWQNVVGLEEVASPILTSRAWFCLRLGRFSEGRDLASLSWSIVEGQTIHNFTGDHARTLYTLGLNHWYLGEYEQANLYFYKILTQAKSQEHPLVATISRAYAYHGLTFAAMSKGEFDIALGYLEILGNEELDLRLVAQNKTILAQVYCYFREYDQVATLLAEARTFFSEMNDLFMIVYNDCSWGIYYRAHRSYDLAKEHLEAAASSGQLIGDPWLEMFASLLLADVLFKNGEQYKSSQMLEGILSQAQDLECRPQVLNAIVQTCRNKLQGSNSQTVVENALAYASRHWAADFETKSLANSLLTQLGVSRDTSLFSLAKEPQIIAKELSMLLAQ